MKYFTKQVTLEGLFNKKYGLFNLINFDTDYSREFVWDIGAKNEYKDFILSGLPTNDISINKIDFRKYDIVEGKQRLLTAHELYNSEKFNKLNNDLTEQLKINCIFNFIIFENESKKEIKKYLEVKNTFEFLKYEEKLWYQK